MRLEFENDELRQLAHETEYGGGEEWNPSSIRTYRKRLQSLEAAADLADLSNLQSLRFKQQDGQGPGLSSLHLSNRRRLFLRFIGSEGGEMTAVVLKVTDHE